MLRPTRDRLYLGQQPLGPCTVDWQNALTYGMFDCLLWSDGAVPPANLVVPNLTTLTSSPTSAATAGGNAGYATGGSGFNIPDHGSIGVSDFAIHMIFVANSWPNSFTALIDKGNATNRDCSVFVGTTGNISFVSFGAGAGSTVSTTTAFATNVVNDLFITRTGITVSIYANGVLNLSFSQAGGTATTDPCAFGTNPSAGGANGDTKYIAFQSWKRAMTATEALAIYQAPYSFIIPAEGEMPALKSPAVDVLSAQACM